MAAAAMQARQPLQTFRLTSAASAGTHSAREHQARGLIKGVALPLHPAAGCCAPAQPKDEDTQSHVGGGGVGKGDESPVLHAGEQGGTTVACNARPTYHRRALCPIPQLPVLPLPLPASAGAAAAEAAAAAACRQHIAEGLVPEGKGGCLGSPRLPG